MMAIHEAEVPEVFRASQEESVHEDALGAHLRDGVGGVLDRRAAFVGCAEGVLLTSGKARRVIRARIGQDDQDVFSVTGAPTGSHAGFQCRRPASTGHAVISHTFMLR